jgi:hypothetical protein
MVYGCEGLEGLEGLKDGILLDVLGRFWELMQSKSPDCDMVKKTATMG